MNAKISVFVICVEAINICYIFCLTVPLSKTLQNLSISAAQRKEIVHLVIETLSKDRCDEKFELFWSNLMNKKTRIRCSGPEAAR